MEKTEIIPLSKSELGQLTGGLSLHFTTNGSLMKTGIIDKIAALEVPTIFQIRYRHPVIRFF